MEQVTDAEGIQIHNGLIQRSAALLIERFHFAERTHGFTLALLSAFSIIVRRLFSFGRVVMKDVIAKECVGLINVSYCGYKKEI